MSGYARADCAAQIEQKKTGQGVEDPDLSGETVAASPVISTTGRQAMLPVLMGKQSHNLR
jgi:hypothetical protein